MSPVKPQTIDAHQHFWRFDPNRDTWITDEMHKIRRDFLPSDLHPILQANGIDGCIAVQADQSIDETDFLLDLANQNDFIKGVVGWIDLQSPSHEETLSQYKKYPKLKGFRHVLQGETDRALMLKPGFKRGVAALGKHNYTYDILIYPDQLGYTKDFVAAFPDQPFVLDHIAKPHIKHRYITDEWKDAIRAVAAFPNLYCKISGMVTEADWFAWKPEHFKVYIDTIVEAFGTNRIMYGSDWPVCLVAASYDQVIGIVRDYFAQFSKDEQAAFFGGNAVKFYNL
ncbi:MAG TPA: amidohydrolase family protein [Puia sp.]|uniref:amidohydrolase family protein n=1 Tax=Puia sp. TaxID=2045100 RepID=UPI002BF44D3C|nr:amidohydrolase family protein [Puia sp.]HVU93973.1 amidohydrolase family protein [Puia sp.]